MRGCGLLVDQLFHGVVAPVLILRGGDASPQHDRRTLRTQTVVLVFEHPRRCHRPRLATERERVCVKEREREGGSFTHTDLVAACSVALVEARRAPHSVAHGVETLPVLPNFPKLHIHRLWHTDTHNNKQPTTSTIEGW